MNSKKEKLDKIWYLLVYALALFPILPRGIESILMLSLFLISIIFFLKQGKNALEKQDVKVTIIFSTIFILYLLGTIYSNNLKESLKFIIRSLPIIMFPLVFGILRRKKLDKNNLNVIFNLHIFSLLLALIFIQTYLYFNTKLPTNWEYRLAFEKLTDIHGTYFSIWISFGVLILFNKIIEAFSLKRKGLFVLFLIIGYFIYWQMVIGARLPLFATILLLIILLIIKIKKKRIAIFSISLLFAFIAIISFIKPNYLSRIKQLAKYDYTLPKGDYRIKQGKITNEQIRNGIYYCANDLIKKSWLVGYGIGDVNDKLQSCYKEKIESNVYQIFNFNTHNQYLHIFLSSGLLGLLFFLCSLLFPLFIVSKMSDYLYLVFTLLILITLITENVLNRHDGILFYSYFNSIFAFLNREVKN